MSTTSIQWTSGPNGEPGYSFNPWLGCAKVHAGCTHCYAEKAQPVVMRKGGGVRWGEVWQGGQRVVVSDSTWKKPFQWAREAARAYQRRKVFCASLADVLEMPPDPPRALGSHWEDAMSAVRSMRRELSRARDRLWDIIRATVGSPDVKHRLVGPGLDWLLLTKRPENWHVVPEDVRPLVWLGTSIADQGTAEDLIPRLLDAEGFRYRFLSAEPLVGPVELDLGRCEAHGREFVASGHPVLGEYCSECSADGWSGELSFRHWLDPFPDQGINWVIVGGESGSRARPCDVSWIRDVVQQCGRAGTACFVKQLGTDPFDGGYDANAEMGPALAMKDPKGGEWSEWPEDLRVRQWPDAMEGRKP